MSPACQEDVVTTTPPALSDTHMRRSHVSGVLMLGSHVFGTHTWGSQVSNTFILHILVTYMRTER